MTQPLDLDAIQARCDAATEGPWFPDYVDGAVHDLEGRFVAQTAVNDPNPNVAFIAAARTDVPALIARVRELEADLTEMIHCRDNAIRALHRDDIETDINVEDAIADALWGVGWDWEDERTPGLIARDVAPAIRPALAKTTQLRDQALARVAELEQQLAAHQAAQGPLPGNASGRNHLSANPVSPSECGAPHPDNARCVLNGDHDHPHDDGQGNTWS